MTVETSPPRSQIVEIEFTNEEICRQRDSKQKAAFGVPLSAC
jgi:hypothetical protein